MQLRTRLTGLFIVSVMLGIGAVLFFQSMLVRGFVSESLLDRQYSEVSYIAAEVDDEIRLRLDWVSLIAARITPEILADPALLARYLQDRQIATKLFNGGIFVIAANGVCVGSHPATPPRIGIDYSDRDYFQLAMERKRAVVGKPLFGRALKQPVVVISASIVDASGKPIGVFAGAIIYTNVNFLGRLPALQQVQRGRRIYIDAPVHDLIVTASDANSILHSRPANPADANILAQLAGRQTGKHSLEDSAGHPLAVAVQTIPSAAWRVVLVTPESEILAGVNHISFLVYLGALAFALLLAVLVRLAVRRAFAPLEEATKQIASMMTAESGHLHPLPHDQDDEIGKLIQSFNALQERVSTSDQALRNLTGQLEQRVAQEVRENREKDHILIQQSRLAAMGEMIHNIAHQWRQPLNALAILLANIKDDYKYHELSEESLDDAVAKAHQLLQRMSTTVDDFRDFFRPDREPGEFEIGQAVEDALFVMEASLRSNDIEVTKDLPQGIRAYGYSNQFAQVVLNVIANAKDAIKQQERERGRIEIHLGRSDGKGVLTIQDNGGGIVDDVMPRVFDPYFTTKPQGSGIGLYMTRMIIERNLDGSISIANHGTGARVTIVLPLITDRI